MQNEHWTLAVCIQLQLHMYKYTITTNAIGRHRIAYHIVLHWDRIAWETVNSALKGWEKKKKKINSICCFQLYVYPVRFTPYRCDWMLLADMVKWYRYATRINGNDKNSLKLYVPLMMVTPFSSTYSFVLSVLIHIYIYVLYGSYGKM